VDHESPSTVPEPSAQPSPVEGPQAKIEMVFRFWGAGARGSDPPAGENGAAHHPGVLALIEDAVASRRGVLLSTPDPIHEQLYISGLRQPSDALVVSRQVQLGLQGFRGRQGAGPVAVSIAIDAGAAGTNGTGNGIEPPHDLVTLLKLSRPAQVLLTHDMCQRMEEIKGLPLKSFPGRFGVYEYLWTAEDKLDLLQSEPQLTLTAMPAVAASATSPVAAQKEKTVAASAAGHAPVHPEPADRDMVAREPAAFPASRMILFGVLGLLTLIVAIAMGVHFMHAPASSSAPAGPVAPAAAPAAAPQPEPSAATAVQPAVETQPARPQPAEKPHTAAAHPAARAAQSQPAGAAEQKPAPAPQPECALAMDTGRLVTLGEQARGRGDYANAIRIFREVLACDPNNAAARSGLDKAMSAQQPQ
jgi:hypothetical protein